LVEDSLRRRGISAGAVRRDGIDKGDGSMSSQEGWWAARVEGETVVVIFEEPSVCDRESGEDEREGKKKRGRFWKGGVE
jgi:hypothetical protein